MKTAGTKRLSLMLALLIAPVALFSQNKDNDHPPPVAGVVELGSRWSWGDVYGRSDLPFDPALKTSKYNDFAFSSFETVPITTAPICFNHCTNSRPMPPAAACTSTVEPRLMG